MRVTGTQSTQCLWRQVVRAASAALYLVLILAATALASDVKISDQAGVLNQSQVHNVASDLGYPVSIYTVSDFYGSTQRFDQRAANMVANNGNMIVVAIDTNRQHVFVAAGRDVPLTQADKANAVQTFISGFKSGHHTSGGSYTNATVNSLNSLKSSLGTRGGGGDTKSRIGIGTCLLGLLILGGLIFLLMRKSRSRVRGGRPGGFAGLFNRRPFMNPDGPPPYQGNPPPYQGNIPPYQGNPPPYQQGNVPPYQGNYPPYQGDTPPYYGSGYPPQQRGINPLAAGGLGAAAGGLLGYELGKSQGEREARGESGGDFGSGEDTSAGAGGFFGGGDTGSESGGDFGNGGGAGGGAGDTGGDFGNGGDAGGGAGGNF